MRLPGSMLSTSTKPRTATQETEVSLTPVEAYAAFPVHTLPEPVGELIRRGAEAIGCDPAYVALPALAALASAIGDTRRIRLKHGWSEPAVLWTGDFASLFDISVLALDGPNVVQVTSNGDHFGWHVAALHSVPEPGAILFLLPGFFLALRRHRLRRRRVLLAGRCDRLAVL